MEELLNQLYYDAEHGFISSDKLYRKANKLDPKITRKIVKDFLSKQAPEQINKQPIKSKEFKPILGPIGQWNIDLMFYTSFKRLNKGYHIILTAIEINSKYAYAYPLKTKSKDKVVEVIEQLFNDIRNDDKKIVILHSDKGSEFKNDKVKKLCEEYGVEQMFCREGDHTCNGTIERFNKTLRGLLNKYMSHTNKVVWFDVLDKLIKNYNSTYHSSIKKEPKDISEADELEIIFNKIKATFDILNKEEVLEVGDKVRIREKKGLFEKGGFNYSKDIYVIEKVNGKSVRIEGKLIPKTDILKINQESTIEEKKPDERKKAISKSRVRRRLAREGI